MKKAAFIGSGNMGGALIRAACRAIGPDQVLIADAQMDKAEALAAELGCALYDMRDQFLAMRDLRGLLCVDGIHPNQQGYEFISNYATKRLNEVYDVVI